MLFNPDHTPSEKAPPQSAPPVNIDQLSVSYGANVALRNASLSIAGGTLMALVGPSGCGKTSLLQCINRMTDTLPNCRVSGDIDIGGESVLSPSADVQRLRRRVGMVFQQPNPFPLSIAENLRFPMREHGIHGRRQLDVRMEWALRDVGLWDEVHDRLGRSALELSGGQQQRLCIARALVLEPQVLLLDEPCSALDPIASEHVEALIQSLKGQYTIIMVTHNLAQARRLADHVTVCWVDQGCGCVIESDSHENIFLRPRHPLTRAYCVGEKG